MLQHVAVCCSTLQYVAVCCSMLQCVAVCCGVSTHIAYVICYRVATISRLRKIIGLFYRI